MKGQISLFLVLGVVLLGIAIGAYYLISVYSVDDDLDSKGLVLTGVGADACVRQVALEGLRIIGLQGGVLFDSDGGPYASADTDTYVSILSQENIDKVYTGLVKNPNLVPPPAYPIPGADALVLQQTYDNVWGINTLPPLCDQAAQHSTAYCSRSSFDDKNIQRQLKQFIQSNVNEWCLDREGNNLDWEGANFEVFFNLDDVAVYVRNVKFVSSGEVAVELPVRLKRIYTAMYQAVRSDARDILFNKQTDLSTLAGCSFPGSSYCFTEGLTYSVLRDVTPSGHDLLVIRDEKSIIDGTSFAFYTAIENRRPVVNLLVQPAFELPQLAKFRNYAQIYGPIGGELFINPQVLDADQDFLTVTYEGWGQTTFSEFDNTNCCRRGVCALGESSCYSQISTGFPTLMDSLAYQSHPECGSSVCVNMTITDSMRGLHSLTIRAHDGYLEDYTQYDVLISTPQDILGNLNDLMVLTNVSDDVCDFFVDLHYLGGVSEFPVANCGGQYLQNNPPDGVESYAAWLAQCDVDVTAQNLNFIRDWNDLLNLARPDQNPPAVGESANGCFYRKNVWEGSEVHPPEYYVSSGPFDDKYALDSPGWSSIGPGGPLACMGSTDLSDDTVWWKGATQSSSETGTKCKYSIFGIPCTCWQCTGATCDLYISYR